LKYNGIENRRKTMPKIHWSTEEIEKLEELVKDGNNWDSITETLNDEFHQQGEERTQKSVFWFWQRYAKSKRDEGKAVPRAATLPGSGNPSLGKPRQPRVSNATVKASDFDGFKITVTDSSGNVMAMVIVDKSLAEIMSALKEVL
jgi:hypothetical protein